MKNHIDYVLFSMDPVIFSIKDETLHVLVVKRNHEPFSGKWSLPGGRADKDACSDLARAFALKLEEKTGIKDMFFEQIQTYGGSEMDPRGWSVTTSYLALTPIEAIDLNASPDGTEMKWVSLESIGKENDLAFWHNQIVKDAHLRLRSKSFYTDLPVNLMRKKFTYAQLRHAYEVILGVNITRQSFTRRMDDSGIFEQTGEKETGSNRPSPYYRKKNQGGFYSFPRMIKG